MGVLGGGQKVYVEKVYVLFRSPTDDKFGELLGARGSQAPPSFWKFPGLPQKFPELPQKFSGDFPGSLSHCGT